MPFNRRAVGANLHPGHLANKTKDVEVVQLQVVSPSTADVEASMIAVMNPASLDQLGFSDADLDPAGKSANGSSNQGRQASRLMLELAAGSDCVLSVRLDERVPEGSIEVSQVQQHNLRVAKGDSYKFRVFQIPEEDPFDLVDIEAEVRPWTSQGPPITVDAEAVAREFAKQCFGIVLAVSQLVVVTVGGERLVIRVAATNVLDAAEQEEAIGYHCYRGILTPTTAVYMRVFEATAGACAPLSSDPSAQQHTSQIQPEPTSSPPESHSSSVSVTQGSHRASTPGTNGNGVHAVEQAVHPAEQVVHAVEEGGLPGTNGKLLPTRVGGLNRLTLINARCRASLPPQTNTVNVYTSDGEWFPVKKKLLRSCIKLTKVVRDTSSEAPTVNISVPTLVFDRVLRYLECEALGKEVPSFSLQQLEELLQAAEDLGLASLEQHCKALLGEAESQLRVYRFSEVQHYNSMGHCWLILDGMILDVTRWLPEHPGGSTIIPTQALNMDCARFFEIYHASRESFVYLKEFYIGELDPMDRPVVPRQTEEPTADFLQQLREYSAFRMQLQPQVFKSF